MSQVHWFPGHMNKALHEIEDKIKMVDVIIELLDARCPISSINPSLEKITSNKKKLVVLTKPDLADPLKTKEYQAKLASMFNKLLVMDITSQSSKKALEMAINELGKDKWEKEKKKGMKPQPIRAMILGIPNVGKSSLINRLASRKAAGVQNKPGFTRGEQWIRVNNNFFLLDTPGILPMNYEEQDTSIKLALCGAIKEEILPNEVLCEYLLNHLKTYYPNALEQRFDIEKISSLNEVLLSICKRRCLLNGKGEPNLLQAQRLLLKEFKDGILGKISLD